MTGHHDTRAAIVAAMRSLDAQGLNQGTSGNVSVRTGDGFLVTPTSLPADAMRPADIPMLALEDGARIEGARGPSSEWRFHRDIYRARPDVDAVVHCHAPHATALAVLRHPIPAVHYMIAAFGIDEIAVADYATYGTQALSDAVVAALGQGWGCLMASHGMLACGETLSRALWRAGELEVLARQYWLARQLGDPVILSAGDLAAVAAKLKEGYGA